MVKVKYELKNKTMGGKDAFCLALQSRLLAVRCVCSSMEIAMTSISDKMSKGINQRIAHTMNYDPKLEHLQRECQKALTCLYIAVELSVANDVNDKVRAYIKELENLINSQKT